MAEPTKVFKEILKDDKEKDRRIQNLETTEYSLIHTIHPTSLFLNNVLLTDGVEYTTASVATTYSLPESLKGIFGVFWITPIWPSVNIYFSASSDTPDGKSPQYRWMSGPDEARRHDSQFLMVPVGPDGKIKLLASGNDVRVFLAITGYWL